MQEKDDFAKKIDKSARNLLNARKEKGTFWEYVSVLVVGGWLLGLPIVGGAFLGKYLDGKLIGGGSISWTLTFIILGVVVGIYNVWYTFIKRQRK